jgi:hypothetical protein
MINNWIEFVKIYAEEYDLSYKEALKEAKYSYRKTQTGGSIKSNYIAKLVASKNDKFDIKRVKNPSQNLLTRYKPKEHIYDVESLNKELTKLLSEKRILGAEYITLKNSKRKEFVSDKIEELRDAIIAIYNDTVNQIKTHGFEGNKNFMELYGIVLKYEELTNEKDIEALKRKYKINDIKGLTKLMYFLYSPHSGLAEPYTKLSYKARNRIK